MEANTKIKDACKILQAMHFHKESMLCELTIEEYFSSCPYGYMNAAHIYTALDRNYKMPSIIGQNSWVKSMHNDVILPENVKTLTVFASYTFGIKCQGYIEYAYIIGCQLSKFKPMVVLKDLNKVGELIACDVKIHANKLKEVELLHSLYTEITTGEKEFFIKEHGKGCYGVHINKPL